MDFLKLLKSLEEFLYEVITWLVFFPLTLWRVARHPQRMACYAETELRDKLEKQFDDALSPPLFLMLAILAAHVLELILHQQVRATSELSRQVVGNEQGLLLFRTLTFALWPLLMAIHCQRRRGQRLDRESLRRPFYAQCYLAAPFAITVSMAMQLVIKPGVTSTRIGWALAAVAAVWYLCVQARWLRDTLRANWWSSGLSALGVLVLGGIINLAIGAVLVLN